MTIALQGAYGKPRPALVIQSDLFPDHASVTILPITGDIVEAPLFRIAVEPTPDNGLTEVSQIMVDKSVTVPREKAGEPYGRIDDATMVAVNRALALFLGFA